MEDCAKCGFVFQELPRSRLAAELRSHADRYAGPLREAEQAGLARTRPEPATWSALEYTCHVRDVYRAQRERLALALAQDRPDFPASKVPRDDRVLRGRYNEAEVGAVLAELAGAGATMAAALEALKPDQWERTGVYHRPDPEERTMDWLARKTLHEAVHHLMDVEREIAQLRASAA